MNKSREKLIDNFKTVTDSGKVITIFVYQVYNTDYDFEKGLHEIPGRIIRNTSTGKPVNKIDEHTYEIVGDDENIRLKKC